MFFYSHPNRHRKIHFLKVISSEAMKREARNIVRRTLHAAMRWKLQLRTQLLYFGGHEGLTLREKGTRVRVGNNRAHLQKPVDGWIRSSFASTRVRSAFFRKCGLDAAHKEEVVHILRVSPRTAYEQLGLLWERSRPVRETVFVTQPFYATLHPD